MSGELTGAQTLDAEAMADMQFELAKIGFAANEYQVVANMAKSKSTQ